MSRLGNQTIKIPEGVEMNFSNGALTVKGPGGTLTRDLKKEISVTVDDTGITLAPVDSNDMFTKALWGTYASHVLNMITGVTEGFKKKLTLEGIGYRIALEGNTLVLNVGFSHQVKMEIPEGIKLEVEKNDMTVSGIDKERVGLFASQIRSVKKPEPYKGKGIRYEDEVVRRKQGKKVVS